MLKQESISKSAYPYPSCWQDEARVQVLLAPFRDRSVNPENYDSKMTFWQNTIKEYCIFKGKANFCKQELQDTFTKGQRVPCCLDSVLNEMQRLKILRLRKDYEYDPENGWSGWAVNSFLKKPLSWGFTKIKEQLGAHDPNQMNLVEYIHLEVIKKYCRESQEFLQQPSYAGALHHYDNLQKELCWAINISEECLRLCLHTLFYQHKIGLEYKQNLNELHIHLVKIPAKDDSNVAITEADHAIHNLQVTKNNLLKQLEDLECDIKENENKARQYLKENKRLSAKTFLRKKHMLEKNHERRSVALHNIETLISNVDEAKHNGVILEAYKFGSKALQNALDASNLKYDNVDEIVSDVRETMDTYKELEDTLANANFNESLTSQTDEDELERELKEIMGDVNNITTTSPIKNSPTNNNISVTMPQKVEITDAELLAMLEGLEVEDNSPNTTAAQSAMDA